MSLAGNRANHFMTEKNKVALVTGASSGIGRALVKILAREGWRVYAVARREAELISLQLECQLNYGAEMVPIVMDLSLPGGALSLKTSLQEKKISLDLLVNNAGLGDLADFENQSLAHILQIIRVNILALTELCHYFIPDLLKTRGKILNVASMAAFQAGPGMAVYYASKAYVLSLSEALSLELKSRVSVTALCPGPTESEFQQVACVQDLPFFNRSLPKAETVALYGYHALMKGQRLAIPGFRHQLLIFSERLLPRLWVLKIIHFLQSRRTKQK